MAMVMGHIRKVNVMLRADGWRGTQALHQNMANRILS